MHLALSCVTLCDVSQAEAIKYSYLNVTARGEPARLLLHVARQRFDDHRITPDEWKDILPTLEWGHVPVLQVGDKKLTQSRTICRYLGLRFGMVPREPWEFAKCDEIVDATIDLFDEYVDFTYVEQDKSKVQTKIALFRSASLPTYLERATNFQTVNSKLHPWLVGKSMTWADIVVAEYLRQISEVDSKAIEKFPSLQELKETVFSLPMIKQYHESKLAMNKK